MPIVIAGVSTLTYEAGILQRINEYNTAVKDYCSSNTNFHYVDVTSVSILY